MVWAVLSISHCNSYWENLKQVGNSDLNMILFDSHSIIFTFCGQIIKSFLDSKEMPLEGQAIKPVLLYSLIQAKMGLFLKGNPSAPLRNGIFTPMFLRTPRNAFVDCFNFWTQLTLDLAGSRNSLSPFLGTKIGFTAPNGTVKRKIWLSSHFSLCF